MLLKLRWLLCDWCDRGIWYEWEGPGPTDGRSEPCSCWQESLYSLAKGYISIRLRLLKRKIFR